MPPNRNFVLKVLVLTVEEGRFDGFPNATLSLRSEFPKVFCGLFPDLSFCRPQSQNVVGGFFLELDQDELGEFVLELDQDELGEFVLELDQNELGEYFLELDPNELGELLLEFDPNELGEFVLELDPNELEEGFFENRKRKPLAICI